jgi:hypothetical protein
MDKRTKGKWQNTVFAIIGMSLLLIIGMVLRPHQGQAVWPAAPRAILVSTTVMAVMAAWWIVFFLRGQKLGDEYHRHRTRAGWLWGGLIGLLVSMPVYAFIGRGGLQLIWPEFAMTKEMSRAFVAGYCLPVFLQCAGLLVAGVWMRLAKR